MAALADPRAQAESRVEGTSLPGAVQRTLADGSSDWLVREEPLVLNVHGQELLTMRTPGRDADLALGFLIGEGVIAGADAVVATELVPGDATMGEPDSVRVTLRGALEGRAAGRLTRTHEIRSSCGVCGLADPEQLLEELPPLLPGVPRLDPAALDDRRRRFEQDQPLFAATGAAHAAMLFGPDGTVWGRGEDVGRHNALDKAIGEAARRGFDLAHATACLSGRAGFDLVIKCLRARVPVILSVSAATAHAFDLSRIAGATLVGFLRGGRAKVYWDGGRLRSEP